MVTRRHGESVISPSPSRGFPTCDRLERETRTEARKALLHEVAGLYEKQLRNPDNALFAWTQALLGNRREHRGACATSSGSPAAATRWGEVLEIARPVGAADAGDAGLGRSDGAPTQRARRCASEAETRRGQRELGGASRERGNEASALAHARVQARRAAPSQALARPMHALAETRTRSSAAAAARASELTAVARAEQSAAESRAPARPRRTSKRSRRSKRETRRTAEPGAGGELDAHRAPKPRRWSPPPRRPNRRPTPRLPSSRTRAPRCGELQASARDGAGRAARPSRRSRRARGDGDGVPRRRIHRDEERATLAAAERAAERGAQRRSRERRAARPRRGRGQRERDPENLARVYVLMGRVYGERLGASDFALSCFSQALAIEPSHDPAPTTACSTCTASAQSWPELVTTLLQRADRAKSPVKARDYARARRRSCIAGKLGDQAQARVQLERVLARGPAAPAGAARAAPTSCASSRTGRRWPQCSSAAPSRAEGQGRALEALLSLGRAVRGSPRAIRISAAAQVPRGARRRAARARRHGRGSSASTRAQRELRRAGREPARAGRARVHAASSASALLERIGLLLEEEFVDHAQAAQCFEDIIGDRPGHEGANTALARLYRQLVALRGAGRDARPPRGAATRTRSRKIELMLQAARVLAVDLGSPRARDRDVRGDPRDRRAQPEALTELARLKTSAGDVDRGSVRRSSGWPSRSRTRSAGPALGPRRQAARRTAATASARSRVQARARRSTSTRRRRPRRCAGSTAQRGDARGAIEMLMHAIEIGGRRAQARGAARRARRAVHERSSTTPSRPRQAFEKALELDRDQHRRARGSGPHRLRRGSATATRGRALRARSIGAPRRAAARPRSAELCWQAARGVQGARPDRQGVAAFKRASEFMPDDLKVAERRPMALTETGNHAAAERLYERHARAASAASIDVGETVRLMLRAGRVPARRQAQQASRSRPSTACSSSRRRAIPDALEALTRGLTNEARDWNEVINLLQLRIAPRAGPRAGVRS